MDRDGLVTSLAANKHQPPIAEKVERIGFDLFIVHVRTCKISSQQYFIGIAFIWMMVTGGWPN
jgi:hypothetical protein